MEMKTNEDKNIPELLDSVLGKQIKLMEKMIYDINEIFERIKKLEEQNDINK